MRSSEGELKDRRIALHNLSWLGYHFDHLDYLGVCARICLYAINISFFVSVML